MGKSIRSKIKKRLRTVKRQRADAMIYTPQTQEHHDALQRVIEGRSVTLTKPKNAFKYPETKGACFPQHTIMKPIDYRAENLPMAGFVFRGNRRKYSKEEQEQLNDMIKNQHPKMEVLAGGGAVLASTGQRISKKEADILATAAERPEDAAIAMAGPANSTSAVARAVAEDEAAAASASSSAAKAGDVDMGGNDPENEVDTSRPPVLKDNRRAKRAAEHRPRSNAVKKKGKVKAQVEVVETPKSKAKAPEAAPAATVAPAAAPAAAAAAVPAPAPAPAAPAPAAPAPAEPAAVVAKKKKKTGKAKKNASMTD